MGVSRSPSNPRTKPPEQPNPRTPTEGSPAGGGPSQATPNIQEIRHPRLEASFPVRFRGPVAKPSPRCSRDDTRRGPTPDLKAHLNQIVSPDRRPEQLGPSRFATDRPQAPAASGIAEPRLPLVWLDQCLSSRDGLFGSPEVNNRRWLVGPTRLGSEPRPARWHLGNPGHSLGCFLDIKSHVHHRFRPVGSQRLTLPGWLEACPLVQVHRMRAALDDA